MQQGRSEPSFLQTECIDATMECGVGEPLATDDNINSVK